MVKVLLVAEQSVVRAGLRFFLSGTEFEVVGEAETVSKIDDAVPLADPAILICETKSSFVALGDVLSGRYRCVFFPESCTKEELLRQLRQGESRKTAEIVKPLTPRETEVLRKITEGLSNKEIAKKLGISVETVKEHIRNLLRKTGLADRTQAALWAVRNNIVPE